jgi:hypothetical protein
MQGMWGLRGAALLAVGALSLHELRYRLIDGTAAGGHGHSYMPLAVALGTVLLVLACASFARTLLRALRGVDDDPGPPAFRVLWPAASAALLGVFFLQEWVEGWVAPGHPAGFGHVAAHIGWAGVGFAVALAAVIALLLRGAHATVRALARRRALPRRRPARAAAAPLRLLFVPRLDVLAAHLAGRAPPRIS